MLVGRSRSVASPEPHSPLVCTEYSTELAFFTLLLEPERFVGDGVGVCSGVALAMRIGGGWDWVCGCTRELRKSSMLFSRSRSVSLSGKLRSSSGRPKRFRMLFRPRDENAEPVEFDRFARLTGSGVVGDAEADVVAEGECVRLVGLRFRIWVLLRSNFGRVRRLSSGNVGVEREAGESRTGIEAIRMGTTGRDPGVEDEVVRGGRHGFLL